MLAKKLTQENISYITTREPGGSPFAETLRGHLLSGEGKHLSPLTRLFLMTAARTDHIHNIIKPALKKGQWVLCDRFYDSTKAYQGYGEHVDLQLIDTVQSSIGIAPDKTFIFLSPGG